MFRDMYTTVSALIEVAAGVDELRQEYDALLAQKTKAVDVFNRLLEADPSSNKVFLHWMIQRVLQDNFSVADLSKMSRNLALYDKYNERIAKEFRNIVSVASYADLCKLVGPFKSNKGVEKTRDVENITELTDDELREYLHELLTEHLDPRYRLADTILPNIANVARILEPLKTRLSVPAFVEKVTGDVDEKHKLLALLVYAGLVPFSSLDSEPSLKVHVCSQMLLLYAIPTQQTLPDSILLQNRAVYDELIATLERGGLFFDGLLDITLELCNNGVFPDAPVMKSETIRRAYIGFIIQKRIRPLFKGVDNVDEIDIRPLIYNCSLSIPDSNLAEIRRRVLTSPMIRTYYRELLLTLKAFFEGTAKRHIVLGQVLAEKIIAFAKIDPSVDIIPQRLT